MRLSRSFSRACLGAGVFAGLLTSAALAADWQQIDRNAKNDSLWVDRESVRREGKLVRYSERMEFATPRTFSDGSKIKTLFATYLLDCAQGKRAVIYMNGISPAGQHIGLSDPPKQPVFQVNDAQPGSPDAMSFKYVCSLDASRNP